MPQNKKNMPEAGETTGIFQLHIQLARTNQASMLAFEKMTGIHPTRWQVLSFLSHRGEVTQKALSRAIMIDAGALTRLLKQLQANGWITREHNPQDNRFTDVKLTAKGRELVREYAQKREEFVEQAMSGIDDAQADILTAALRRIEQNLSK